MDGWRLATVRRSERGSALTPMPNEGQQQQQQICIELLQGRRGASFFIPSKIGGRAADLHCAPIRTSEGGKGGERARVGD